MAKQIKPTPQSTPQPSDEARTEAECCDLYNEYCYPCAEETKPEASDNPKAQMPRIERADKR